ncbi:MAG: AMED_5909 family protein, partial [Pseudonocardiaceae bacterium]
MTMDETTKPVLPQTLAEAHEAVAAIRPFRSAPLTEWLAYHQQAAALYAEVAEIDRGHHSGSFSFLPVGVEPLCGGCRSLRYHALRRDTRREVQRTRGGSVMPHADSWWLRWTVYAPKLPEWLHARGLSISNGSTPVVVTL